VSWEDAVTTFRKTLVMLIVGSAVALGGCSAMRQREATRTGEHRGFVGVHGGGEPGAFTAE
jgi:hypothetical protein